MKQHLVVLATLAALTFGVLPTPSAQEIKPPRPELERRSTALGLLRTINTAEAVDRSQFGSFSSWSNLLAHKHDSFEKWIAHYGQSSQTQFHDMPEIMPGWSLRLNVHADGQGYDVRLQDLRDEKCWYAAISDESGVIRQSLALDCEIP